MAPMTSPIAPMASQFTRSRASHDLRLPGQAPERRNGHQRYEIGADADQHQVSPAIRLCLRKPGERDERTVAFEKSTALSIAALSGHHIVYKIPE